MVDGYHTFLKEYAVSRVNSNVSHGLWVIILNQSSFIGSGGG